MGYDLHGVGETERYHRWNIFTWPVVLTLAREHGWEPMGTVLDEAEGWDGSYHSNDWQIVTKPDAAAMAAALRYALVAVPAGTQLQGAWLYMDSEFEPPMLKDIERLMSMLQSRLPRGDDGEPARVKGGPCLDADRLAEFIEFCEAGAFHIG